MGRRQRKSGGLGDLSFLPLRDALPVLLGLGQFGDLDLAVQFAHNLRDLIDLDVEELLPLIDQVDPPVVELTAKSVLQSGGILEPDHGVDIELERHRSVAQFGSIRCAHGSRSRVGVNALGLGAGGQHLLAHALVPVAG